MNEIAVAAAEAQLIIPKLFGKVPDVLKKYHDSI